jgi:hypothetical protein
MNKMVLSILVPLLAIAVIIFFAGGLGVIFMVLEAKMHSEIGVIVLGTVLLIGVPAGAYLAERAIGEPQ